MQNIIQLHALCRTIIMLAIVLLTQHTFAMQGDRTPLVPTEFEIIEPVRKAIEAEWLTKEERQSLRIFHGLQIRSTDDVLLVPDDIARIAFNAGYYDHVIFDDETVNVAIRAEALAARGDVETAVELIESSQEDNDNISLHASRVLAEALETLGQFERADAAIDEPVRLLLSQKLDSAADLTEGVRALIVRSRLRGQPARDYQTMLNLLARARSNLDRLHWPAVLTEAELLLDKGAVSEAIPTLHQVLGLNPRCARAWYLLGKVALDRFDFDSSKQAADNLRKLNPQHPLADLLLTEAALILNDPDLALQIVQNPLDKWPNMRDALILRAAAIGLSYDEIGLQQALDDFDKLSPGSPLAYYTAGKILSFDRQYEQAADLLNEAIRRQPKWPTPQIELALLELQSGRDALALNALRDVRELDRFNMRVANSLYLLEELMQNFVQVETEYFIVRYSPETDDQVLIDMMVDELDNIHRRVAGRFEHEPDRKTIIEVMPNHKWFGVRIGGMPFIHTIAACTGPVIAMEVPREGPRQLHMGTFDWPRVLQHEYTHTITLSQTRNRIPHWLTEAAAVSMEFSPRGHDRVMALVNAYKTGQLFDLDAINWAFIRPKKQGDRSLAYNQGYWMVQFMNERFGESALVHIMNEYYNGEREESAIQNALGVSRQEFYDEFLIWAGKQVEAWGYLPSPSMEELTDKLRKQDAELAALEQSNREIFVKGMTRVLTERVGKPGVEGAESLKGADWPRIPKPHVEISNEQLEAWLAEYPDHPDVLELAVKRALAMQEEVTFDLVPLLEKYAEARPADPSPHKPLALVWQQSNMPERAIPHLEELDTRSEYTEVYAIALAKLYSKQGEKEKALVKANRAVNINPYFAPHRELAATAAIKANDLVTARKHIVALTLLEPDRPQHEKRLEAIEKMMAD